MGKATRLCGDEHVLAGRDCVVGAYAFFARYILMPRESCLDVGGGSGRGACILKRRSVRVKTIDQDPRLTSQGVEMGSIFDFEKETFDWCVAVDVIEHVEDDIGFVRGLWEVAKKGIWLTTPNLDHHPDRAWPYHLREYTVSGLDDLIDLAKLHERRRYHFGCDAYGGEMSQGNLSAAWEHQAILLLKRSCPLATTALASRAFWRLLFHGAIFRLGQCAKRRP